MAVKQEELIMNIDDLHHPERNVRIHTELQIKELQRSLTMFGQLRPLVIDEKGLVLAGNGLMQAIRELGQPVKGLSAGQARTLRISGLTENQKKKLMLADNRIYDLGVDDLRAIDEFLAELKDDVDIPGFDPDMLQTLVSEADEITTKLSQYGKLSEEQVNRIGTAEDLYSQGTTTPPDKEATLEVSGKKAIHCPHCDRVIWMDE